MLTGYCQLEKIKETSYSFIYQGMRQKDNLPVVIKLIKQDCLYSQAIKCYQQEYKIISLLEHPSIIKAYDFIRHNNQSAIILEDFSAESLRKISARRNFSLEEILELSLQIVDALSTVHQANIIHKDINPSNILFNRRTGILKLIDFGIATQLPKEKKSIQSYKTLEGTLAYISPEQTGRMNRSLDYRSDYYSLGVTLYQLLTQQLPFDHQEPMDLIHAHLAKIPLSPQKIKSEIPQTVSEIVMKLMAKNAEDRYQSATGLKYDLETCLNQLNNHEEVKVFELGQQDISSRFIISDKLYGRETEVKLLLDSFERVAQGKLEMMLVAGLSGIGKTALVNEVYKPITRQQGYFIKGKFDQFNRNIPFSAFVQAFSDLVKQLLSEADEQLTQWKSEILTALGNNAQVIIEVIPNLEIILGKQPEVPELSGSAAQYRFNLVFGKFIQVFAIQEHPLIIFLDDLQWVDSASLGLLKLLMCDAETNTNALLVLGAYRDNEVFPAHPLMLCLQEIEQQQESIKTISLNSLAEPDINCLVADALLCSEVVSNPLSELIYQKTQGNPFFATQFLKGLYEDKYINFKAEKNCWQCDLTKLKQVALTDDVIEFMISRLQKLPEANQDVLKLAACIGNRFDLETLAIICKKSKVEVTDNLWPALQGGLIVPETQIYRIYTEDQFQDTSEDSFIEYRFLHDRVQQAAYTLILEKQKKATHVQIGHLLLKNTSTSQLQEKIFAIANQLNIGIDDLYQASERYELAKLNLIAGKQAKTSTAYGSAITYLRTGIELLPSNSWDLDYDLTLNLYSEVTEVSYLEGEFETMEKFAQQVLQQAKAITDIAKVYEVIIEANAIQGKLLAAIDIGIEFLGKVDIDFPSQPTKADFAIALQETQKILSGKTVASLADLPQVQDPEICIALRILVKLDTPAYIAKPELHRLLVLKEVALCAQYGNITASAFSYSAYGLMLCGQPNRISVGYEFGQLALQLLSQYEAREYEARIIFVTSHFINHWKEPVKKSLQPLLKAYTSGLESGDLQFASLSALIYNLHGYICGQELTKLAQKFAIYGESIRKINQISSLNYNNIYHQSVLNLVELNTNPWELIGSVCNESEMLLLHKKNNDGTALWHLFVTKLTLAYWFDKYDLAMEYTLQAKQYSHSGYAMINFPLLNFYDSLVQLVLFPSSSPQEQEIILQQVSDNQQIMEKWAYHASMNYLHKFHLVEAEKYRALGNKAEAIELYDRAIAGAKENQYIQEEALANELAAKFYLDWGKEKVAAGYMQEAYYCYDRWGAKAKTEQLAKFYPELLYPVLQPKNQAFHPLQALSTLSTYINDSNVSAEFDLQNRIRSAQAITETLELKELLRKVSEVFLQNSGCDRIFIALVNKTKDLQLCVNGDSDKIEVNCDRLEVNVDSPRKLINYVKNTHNKVLVNNLAIDLPILDNYLLQEKPQSILALPLIQKDELIGVLYLHSSRISNIFNPEKIVVLEFFGNQAAIALENARLYRERQEAEVELVHKNAFLQAQLESSLEGILVIDGERKVIAYNQRFVSIWNIPETVLKTRDNQQLLDFVLDQVENPQEFLEKVEYCCNYPEQNTYDEIALKDQRFLERYSSSVTLPSGEYNSTILHFRNITDRKAAEQQLHTLSNKLELAIESAQLGIWEWDLLEECLTWNDRMFEIYGVSPEEFRGIYQDWERRVHPEDLAKAKAPKANITCNSAKAKCYSYTKEFRIIRPDGEIRYILATASIQNNDKGQEICMIGMNLDISDLKVAEQALKDSQVQFKRIAENIPGMVYRWSINTDGCQKFIYISSKVREFFGLEPEAVLQDENLVWQRIHPDDIPLVQDNFAVNTENLESFKMEFRLILSHKGLRWVQINSQPERLENGTVIWDGVMTDITDHKTAEAALKLSEARAKAAFEQAAVGIAENCIESNQITQVNNHFCEMLGYTKSELLKLTIKDITHPDDLAESKAYIKELYHGEIDNFTIEKRYVCKDGSIVWVAITVSLIDIPEKKAQSSLAIIKDISNQKCYEQKILESKAFLQTILDTFPLSIFWKDRESVYIGVNQNFVQDAGFESPKDIIGLTDLDMPWAETEAQAYQTDDREVMISNLPKLGIIETQIQADGTQIWVETNKLPLHNFAGNVIGVMGTYQDISDRKKTEIKLKQTNEELARATRMKDEFLANMSHELRTPLNAILGMTEGLQERILGEVNERQLKALKTIERSGFHLLELINDILDLAKIESGQLILSYTLVELSHLCHSSLAFVQQQAFKKNIQIHLHLPLNIPDVFVDEQRMRQVLINLLNNAVKFTLEAGKITLEVAVQPGETNENSHYLTLAVRDTGIGIPPAKIDSLFQPFVQVDSSLNRQYQGTGLGLGLVKRIVELHQGEVTVKSKLGIGSCFTVKIPCIEHQASANHNSVPVDSGLSSSDTDTNTSSLPLILLAEDNEANIITLTSYLRAKGYPVLVARDGKVAMELAQKELPQVIIMDIQMPEVDGLTAIRQIRQLPELAQIPIIALTALAMEGDRERCLAAGANLYFSKPIKLKKLTLLIQQLLNQS